ncbi:hypothetical protein [Polyangium jinanense]|nr:hypothetical protein [Polyangium jinanense]
MAKGLILLFFAAATLFAACGGEDPETAEDKYCNQRCDCNKCTEDELASCRDDKINQKDEAGDADCKDEYSTYLTCLTNDAACSDGDYDESVCFAEESDLDSCLNPAPTCNLANNGVCNEPAPKGDGLCAAGSDTKDCAIPTCPSAGDGYCDEPEGSGLCAEGSDPIDCGVPTCPSAGDGYCDEPEGTGLCAEGSDPIDCSAQTCQACYNYVLDPSAGSLCETSTSTYITFLDCACVSCADACATGVDVCDAYPISSTCLSCAQELCSSTLNTCISD